MQDKSQQQLWLLLILAHKTIKLQQMLQNGIEARAEAMKLKAEEAKEKEEERKR